jgi:hypothetical protein
MSRAFDNRGQGALEAALSLPLFLGFFVGLGYLIYFGLTYQIGSYHLHEALLCSQSQLIEKCQRSHARALKKILIFNEDFRLQLRSQGKSIEGVVLIQVSPTISIKQSIGKGF